MNNKLKSPPLPPFIVHTTSCFDADADARSCYPPLHFAQVTAPSSSSAGAVDVTLQRGSSSDVGLGAFTYSRSLPNGDAKAH